MPSKPTRPIKIMLIAGEASGDSHGAEVVRALKKHKGVECFGIGSRKMAAAGCRLLFDSQTIAVMGLIEVLKHFKEIKRAWKIALHALETERPDCVILIDYPGFNLRFAEKAKALDIKILYYVSPQIWAWKKKRIHKIKRLVDHMAVILPFEAEIYRKAGVPVTFVGSPLLEQVTPIDKQQARSELNLSLSALIVGLLPGSRESEISRLLPELIDAAEILKRRYPHIQFVIPLADTIKEPDIWPYLDAADVPLVLIKHNSHKAMSACDILIGSSGTATLEAAILGRPMIVIYKMNGLTFAIAKRLVKIPFISLPNILAQKLIYPELIQTDANSKKIAAEAEKMLADEAYVGQISQDLVAVNALLGTPGAGQRVAEIALDLCDNTPPL
jgi:lipid-A-disaccharide synthase